MSDPHPWWHTAVADIADFRDVESLNHYATAVAAGQAPEDVLAALRRTGRDNARTPRSTPSPSGRNRPPCSPTTAA